MAAVNLRMVQNVQFPSLLRVSQHGFIKGTQKKYHTPCMAEQVLYL